MGWAGSILAKELSEAGLSVVGLERGPMQTQSDDFATPRLHDDLRYNIRYGLMQDLSRETITFRNHINETTLPMRQLGSFLPGTGTGATYSVGTCQTCLLWGQLSSRRILVTTRLAPWGR